MSLGWYTLESMDPLSVLDKLLHALPKSCPVYVMGGLALDGHFGKLSRKHDDADLICWRKDVDAVKGALKKFGYEIEANTFPDNPDLEYRFETTDDDHIISFNIIDERPNDSFEISFYHFPKQVFPKRILGPVMVSLDGVTFPAVGSELLRVFNKNASIYLDRVKNDKPELYSRLGPKIDNNIHDRRLLEQLD